MTAHAVPALVVIGASWGGLHAVSVILAALPSTMTTPVAVVQHRARESDGLLAGLLQHVTSRMVCDVEDKQPLRDGHVFLAPPDYHLLVDDDGLFSLSVDAAVRFSRPSIDVAFTSAAEALGPAAIGVLLTGANDDGARGLRRIVDRGGQALVQEPATAEVRTMPEAGLAHLAGAPGERWSIAPLDEIGPRIAALAVGLPAPAGRPTPPPAVVPPRTVRPTRRPR